MSFLDNIKTKYGYSFPEYLEQYKELVEQSNSLSQLIKLTGMSKTYNTKLLTFYNLIITPKCLHCKKPLDNLSIGAVKKYCNDTCAYQHKITSKHCPSCGEQFTSTKGTKYCSDKCKEKAYKTTELVCNRCKKVYIGHKGSKYCSDYCRNKSNSSIKDNSLGKCPACGELYVGEFGCSKECRLRLANIHAKRLLLEVFGTTNKEEIKKGMNDNGKKTFYNYRNWKHISHLGSYEKGRRE